ncbi:MAG: acylphosphatase [Candidatus Aminicenantales bacterium]
MNERLRASIRGDVQGVSFRWFIAREAGRLHLRGWVRNRRDGRVEVLAEGERTSLEALIVTLRRGPRLARVDDVDLLWEGASGEFDGFQIEATV